MAARPGPPRLGLLALGLPTLGYSPQASLPGAARPGPPHPGLLALGLQARSHLQGLTMAEFAPCT